VSALLQILNISADQVDAITFASIKSGSVILVGTATPPTASASSVSDASNALSQGLASSSNSLGFTVTSSSVVSNGIIPQTSTGSTNNVPLIVGLTLGLAGGIIVILLIILYFFKRNKKLEEKEEGGNKRIDESLQVMGDCTNII
jgi:beta-lactamase regulating signal transducer with metallopeptidase domain